MNDKEKNVMQTKVAEVLRDTGTRIQNKPFVRLADISSELGELQKEILKATAYGSASIADNMRASITEEFGDMLYSMIAFAEENGIDIDVALDTVIQKYRDRFDRKGAVGSDRGRGLTHD